LVLGSSGSTNPRLYIKVETGVDDSTLLYGIFLRTILLDGWNLVGFGMSDTKSAWITNRLNDKYMSGNKPYIKIIIENHHKLHTDFK